MPPVHDLSGQKFTFTYRYNRITSTYGWRPIQIPEFDPVGPAMVIHDLLEHFKEGTAEVHWEYQALGAAHLIRHEGGYFGTKRISDELVPPAFGMLFHHIVHGNLPTEPAPAFAYAPLDNVETELEIIRTIGKAADFSKDKFRYSSEREAIRQSLVHALGWMKIGYRRAQERYKGYDLYELSNMWKRAQAAVEKIDATSDSEDTLSLVLYPEKYQVKVISSITV